MWQWHPCVLCFTCWQHPFLEQLHILGLTSFNTAEEPGEPAGFYQQINGAEQFLGLCPIKCKNHPSLANISVCYPSPFKIFPPSFSGGETTEIPLALGSCKREKTCMRQKAGNETMDSLAPLPQITPEKSLGKKEGEAEIACFRWSLEAFQL